MHEIGIMQGRLLPRFEGRYQAFPKGYWQAEFPIAKAIGLAHIEFIIDYNDWETNPILTDDGNSQLTDLMQATGVGVRAICADYFMHDTIFGDNRHESVKILNQMIVRSSKLGVRDITVPCVDQSSIRSKRDQENLIAALRDVGPFAQKHDILVNIEADLEPAEFASVLEAIGSPAIKVNYDTGNSASLGFDPREEFSAYGAFISNLHIKDRKKGGGSVLLGTGDCQFERVFQELKKISFQGNVTLQASRAEHYCEEIPRVLCQMNMARVYLNSFLM